MIRRIQKKDVEKIAEIWLNTNLKAHDFIKAEYWTENFPMVKDLFCQAEVYVYEEASEILSEAKRSLKELESSYWTT